MKNKETMDSKQLALEFGASQENESSDQSIYNNINNVIQFSSRQVEEPDFRDRVLADLIRNKIIVD